MVVTRRKNQTGQRASNGTRFSDEVLCAFTRGLYVPQSRDTRPKRPETGVPDDQACSTCRFASVIRIARTFFGWITGRPQQKSPSVSAEKTVTGEGGAHD